MVMVFKDDLMIFSIVLKNIVKEDKSREDDLVVPFCEHLHVISALSLKSSEGRQETTPTF